MTTPFRFEEEGTVEEKHPVLFRKSTYLCYDWASRSKIPDILGDLQRVEALRNSKQNFIWLYKLEALMNGMLEYSGMLGAVMEGIYNVKAFSRTISSSPGSEEFDVPVLIWLQDEFCLHIGRGEHRYILFFQLNGSTPNDSTDDMWTYSKANLRLYDPMFKSTERPRTIHVGNSLECIIKFSEWPAFVHGECYRENSAFGIFGRGFALMPLEGHSLQNLLSEVVTDFVDDRSGSANSTSGRYEDSFLLRKNSQDPLSPSFVRVGGYISLQSLEKNDIFDPEKVWEVISQRNLLRRMVPRDRNFYSHSPLQKEKTLRSQGKQDKSLPPQCTMDEARYRRLVKRCVMDVNMVSYTDRICDMACDHHSTGEIIDAILAIRRCRGDVKFNRESPRGACVVCSVNTTSTASTALVYSRTMAGPEYHFYSDSIDVEDTWCDRYAGGIVYLACVDMWADVEKQIFRDSRKQITIDPSVERIIRRYCNFEPTYWLCYELHFSGIEFDVEWIHSIDRLALSYNTALGYRWLMSVMKAYNTFRDQIPLLFDQADIHTGGSVLGCVLVTRSTLRAIDVAFWIDLWSRSENGWEGVARRGNMEAQVSESQVEMEVVGSPSRWILHLESSGSQGAGHVVRIENLTRSLPPRIVDGDHISQMGVVAPM